METNKFIFNPGIYILIKFNYQNIFKFIIKLKYPDNFKNKLTKINNIKKYIYIYK